MDTGSQMWVPDGTRTQIKEVCIEPRLVILVAGPTQPHAFSWIPTGQKFEIECVDYMISMPSQKMLENASVANNQQIKQANTIYPVKGVPDTKSSV
jgi:hypothetical protein